MRHHPTTRRRRFAALAGATTLALATAACAPTADSGDGDSTNGEGNKTVTLVTHDSWAVPKSLVKQFEDESGYQLEVLPNGDAGEVTNKLVLTKDQPLGDVVYGIDNTFAGRAVDEGVLAAYTPADAPASVADYEPEGDAADVLTPVDWGDVCINVDDTWFRDHDLAPPASLDDLTAPAYRDLLVTPGAASSSPGLAFLLATVAKYGDDGWEDYWRDLVTNGMRVTSGWTDAYEVDFSGGPGHGDRPIVLSYSSSPPFTIPKGGDRPTTSAVLDTCYRQVEYAGVLTGAANPEGAHALVDFLVSRDFQEALPDNMYVYPVDADAALPKLWARWATPASSPFQLDPADVDAHRSDWLRSWSDLTSG